MNDLQRNYAVLESVLLFIINGCIEHGVIPDDLKVAVVKPLYKSGSRSEVDNYRPISILPAISQIIEKHLLIIMTNFLNKNNILSEAQFGFIQGRSTITLLEEFTDIIYSAFDNNEFACGLFLDASKAFDSVIHALLLKKLERIGFRGPFIKLLSSYFSNRSQVVRIGDYTSSKIMLKSGVPQGSVLSPLLFNLYVNELPQFVSKCRLFQYADDTVLLSTHASFDTCVYNLQADATSIMNWCTDNGIGINRQKTKLVCFHNPHKRIDHPVPFFVHDSKCINCKCTPLQFSSNVKYLGIMFDSDMTWNTHFTGISKKLRSLSCLLYNTRHLLPFSVRKVIVHALVYSYLRYGITIFYHCTFTWRAKLNSMLKSILRNVAYNEVVPPNTDLFSFLQLPSFDALFFQTVVTKHFWESDFLFPFVPIRQLRHHDKFITPKCYTRFGRYTRQYYVPNIFNSLPTELYSLSSKRALKLYLRTNHSSLL